MEDEVEERKEGMGGAEQPLGCRGRVVDSGVTVSLQLWLLVVPYRNFFGRKLLLAVAES